MLLGSVAAASVAVAADSKRLAKIAALAEVISAAPPDEVPIVVSWLSGELTQRQIGVGWAALRGEVVPSEDESLEVADVQARLTEIGSVGGAGSKARRAELLTALFAAATDVEQRFLRALIGGELRQGALAGVMVDAVARAADVPVALVRRAAMLSGDLPATAGLAVRDGAPALEAIRLTVGVPVAPMLAKTAASATEAVESLGGRAVIEAKLDGARIQIHKNGAAVSIWTRTLDDVTARLPEIVAAVAALPADTLIADGEAIALRPDGRPHSFQVTASRFGRSVDIDTARSTTPLTPVIFDLLHVDGRDLIDEPLTARIAAMEQALPDVMRIGRVLDADPDAAEAFTRETLAAGHEGVVVKSPELPYQAGRRGAGWLKVKPVHTLDLVVLAVEWGSGRRKGWLSNIHLGARDPDTGGFVMLGKTFKGMTDEMLAWQTLRFTELADGPTDGWVVRVRPEQVVEIAFDGLQRSSRYPGGLALRFARVLRYRDDKTAADADTIETVRAFATD